MGDDDKLWSDHGEREGWVLPLKASLPLRLPLVRDIRAELYWWRAAKRYRAKGVTGIALCHLEPYDNWVSYAIATGKA